MLYKCIVLMSLLGSAMLCQAQTVNKQIENLVDTYAALRKFNGSILVAQRGEILLRKGYGYKNFQDKTLNDAKTVYQIASVTKSFTATLVLKLVETNKLALTDRIAKFYPQIPKSDSITIEQLLSHTSGISDNDSLTKHKTYKGSDEEQFIATLTERSLDFAPGSDFRYSNSGYILLGYIVQKVTGTNYYDAIKSRLFQPLQMEHSGFDFTGLSGKDKATGYWEFPTSDTVQPATLIEYFKPAAAGAIYSTVDDLFKWHQGLQSGKIVGKALLERAYTPVKGNYGYGWIIDSVAQAKVVWHSGDIWGFKSELARVPADDICIAMLSNIEDVDLHIITQKILAMIYGQPYQFPAQNKLQLAPEVRKEYVGEYSLRPGEFIKVTVENHSLMATTSRKQELYAQQKDKFLLDDGREQLPVTFTRDSIGKVTALSFTIGDRKIVCPKNMQK
ncbi:MAG: serine hydrolase domain-containing protein [Dyadobacter fermentans]